MASFLLKYSYVYGVETAISVLALPLLNPSSTSSWEPTAPAHCSCTLLLHAAPARRSCTPLLHTAPAHTAPAYTAPAHCTCTHCSCMLLLHTAPALRSCTPILHAAPARRSCTPLLHTAPARRSCTPLLHAVPARCSCMLTVGYGFGWKVIGYNACPSQPLGAYVCHRLHRP